MDLAIYINELLGLHGEVYVPGVGYFAQKRIEGHYNDGEKKLYPPRHEIVFDPEPRDDDELAAYISKKKNISPASAKYFIEKYTTSLKQQASEQKASISGLGELRYEYAALTFKADKNAGENDPTFYGFSPVKTAKEGQPAIVDVKPIKVTPHAIKSPKDEEQKPGKATASPVDEPRAEEETPAEVTIATTKTFVPAQVIEEEPDHRARNIRIVILLIVIIVLLLFGIAYQYNPGLFSANTKEDTTVIIKTLPAAAKGDSVTKKDTSTKSLAPAQTIIPAVDTFAIVHYDIWGGSYKTLTKTNAVIKDYQKLGLPAKILQHSAGLYHHIVLGTYFDRQEAIRVEDSIKNIKGIDKAPISLQPYIPPKK
ncbi:MAG: hypothetical protein ACHQHN_00275 [Sphingobacteriales bacterium]